MEQEIRLLMLMLFATCMILAQAILFKTSGFRQWPAHPPTLINAGKGGGYQIAEHYFLHFPCSVYLHMGGGGSRGGKLQACSVCPDYACRKRVLQFLAGPIKTHFWGSGKAL